MIYRRSLHSVYDIEYHVVFYAKYRRRAIYGNIAEMHVEAITEVCFANYVAINENMSLAQITC
ncbi:MAG: transposase [Alphaproteobacteria bacterium]|nr:transposase [Alphaproteobacteria bacterium]